MPPRGRGARGGATGAAATGRTSSRIAEKVTAAQQAAAEQAAQEREAAANAPPDASMPPPSTRGRGRGRPPRASAEGHARRGTMRRGSRSGNSIASYTPAARDTPATSDIYGTQANGVQPFTPQRAEAASMVYGSIDSYREAGELTPRTLDATSNLMNKSIDRLYLLAKDLIRHLSVAAEARDESWVDELRFHKDVFNRFYEVYAQEGDPFIDITSVGAKTKSSEVPMLWERMIKGVSTANIANLMSDVEDLDGDPSNVLNRLPLLQRLDDHFPTAFAPGGQKGLEENPHWVDSDTAYQAFTIRVHRFIESLRGVEEVAPIRHYATIFLNMDFSTLEDHDIEQFLNKTPLTPLRDFAGFDINGPFMQKYRDDISSFRAMLWDQTEENHPVDTNTIISELEKLYAFDMFLQDLKEWVKSFEEKIPGPARPAYNNGDSAYAADAQLQAEAAAASPTERSTPTGVDRLRQHIAASSAAQSNPRAEAESPFFNNFDDEVSIADTDADMLARSRAAATQAQYLMSGADNGALYAVAAADSSKQVGGRKRGRKPAAEGDSAAKRARANDAAAMPPPPVPAIELGPLPPASVAFDPVALSQRSQLISKANRRPAQPKQRKPWTSHDTQQLVRAVDVYKAKWSTIEKAIREGHIAFNVPERDQQGLRDKARLVKVDILKTDAALPPGFDLVVLGRKEKEMVMQAGRNPERREDDVDAAGNVTNSLYDPEAAAPMQQDIQAAPQVFEDSSQPQESSDASELRPLQEAHMVTEAPMDGAPDAPMGPADMGAPPSEALGEDESVVDSSIAPPIDPSISEADPSPAAVQV